MTVATAVSVGGPSAAQLAHGRWLKMPTAPIRLCYPLSVWDGHDLVVVEPGWPHCRAAAATYNPRTNSWAAIAAPPKLLARSRLFGPQPVAAWGDGRLVLVSPVTGVTVTWRPATGRWRQIGTLPSRGAVSASWTGSKFLVITAKMIAVNNGTARAFSLTGGRWTRLPDLPQPGKGQIVEAVTAADVGAVYALADINVAHTNPDDMYNSGHVELLRLTPAAWTPVPLPSGAPLSQLALTQVDGANRGRRLGMPRARWLHGRRWRRRAPEARRRPRRHRAAAKTGSSLPPRHRLRRTRHSRDLLRRARRYVAGAGAGKQRDLRHRHRQMATRPHRP